MDKDGSLVCWKRGTIYEALAEYQQSNPSGFSRLKPTPFAKGRQRQTTSANVIKDKIICQYNPLLR
jgi:hypothetical protein